MNDQPEPPAIVRHIPMQPLAEMAQHWVRLGLLDPVFLSLAHFGDAGVSQ